LKIEADVFMRYLGLRLTSWPPDTNLVAALAACHATDLFLACAAGAGVTEAIEILLGTHLEGAMGAVRKVHPDDEFLAEVNQLLRQKLFVSAEGERPKILSFSGRAPLSAWLAAVAQKAALSQRRAEGTYLDLKRRIVNEPDVALDPELRHLQLRYRNCLGDGLRQALAQLSERSRALLRLHVFLGMTLEQLATVYNVNDATISRWLAKARAELLEETGRYVRATTGVSDAEFSSLARVLVSQLDVSIARLLFEPAVPR